MKSGFTQLAAAGVVGMALTAGGTLARSPENIVDTAVAAGQFKTLTAAINAAGADQNPRGSRPVHGVRANRCGLRQAARRYCQ
jgi:pectin methylesterase-like acyl-CoA thioesterase